MSVCLVIIYFCLGASWKIDLSNCVILYKSLIISINRPNDQYDILNLVNPSNSLQDKFGKPSGSF